MNASMAALPAGTKVGRRELMTAEIRRLILTPTRKQAPALKELTVPLRKEQFVLVFECDPDQVPSNHAKKGVQMVPMSGGSGGSAHPEATEIGRYKMATVDLKSLMARVSVDNINVVRMRGVCHVYVNCTVVASGERGWSTWGKSNDGIYRKFVTGMLSGTAWKTSVVREFDDKTSLSLRRIAKEPAEAVIRFEIKQ